MKQNNLLICVCKLWVVELMTFLIFQNKQLKPSKKKLKDIAYTNKLSKIYLCVPFLSKLPEVLH